MRRRVPFGFVLAVVWLVVLGASALLAPILPLANPDQTDVTRLEMGPSWQHWFGTDSVGRDVFSRAIWGSRISLVVGIAAVAFGFVVGGVLGLIAGYLRSAADTVISFVFDTLLAFPAIVFIVLITSLTQRSLTMISLVLGILAVAPLGRLARAATMSYASEPFVTAARAVGATNWRILLRELAPNVIVPMSSFALLGCGIAIVAEGSLAFLGLSVDQQISWGKIIVDGSNGRTLRDAPHVALTTIGMLFVTILALNLVGSHLQRRGDSRTSKL